MPPRTRILARKKASGESASKPHDPLQRGRGHGHSRGRRGVNAVRHGSTTGVANAEVPRARKGNQQQNLDGRQGVRQVDQQPGATTGGIEVTLAEFMKLKPFIFPGSNANYDPQRDTGNISWITSVGLRHAPYPITEKIHVKRFVRGLREYIFRSMVGSNCSIFAEVLSLALQLEQRQKEKRGSGRDSRKKQRVKGSQSSHPRVGVGSVPGYQGRSSRTTFPQQHFRVTSTPCPTCGRLHTRACFGDSRFGGSSSRGSGVAQQSGRGSGGRGQAQAGRGQARVFARTRQDA
ncbi:hypothetical protein SESBI_13706 [Sesbania bispinosa]|nr:hypothetical protein SESBI_13706 [Sesbania bispinosa]